MMVGERRHVTVGLAAIGALAVVMGSVLPSYGINLHPSPNLDFIGPDRFSLITRIGDMSVVYPVAWALREWAAPAVALVSVTLIAWGPADVRQIARGSAAAAGVISGFAALYWLVSRLTIDQIYFPPIYLLIGGHASVLLAGLLSLSRLEAAHVGRGAAETSAD